MGVQNTRDENRSLESSNEQLNFSLCKIASKYKKTRQKKYIMALVEVQRHIQSPEMGWEH